MPSSQPHGRTFGHVSVLLARAWKQETPDGPRILVRFVFPFDPETGRRVYGRTGAIQAFTTWLDSYPAGADE